MLPCYDRAAQLNAYCHFMLTVLLFFRFRAIMNVYYSVKNDSSERMIPAMKTLSASAHAILNDSKLIACREQWFSRLTNLFASAPDPYNDRYVFTVDGIVPRPDDADVSPYTDPEDWVITCLELLAAQADCVEERFCPPCVEYPIYGVHFIDRMLGGHVYLHAGQWHTDYLKTPVGSLEMPDLGTDETWNLARRAAEAFLSADVKLPLFGLPTLSSALNILVNLYGEEALAAMYEDEDAVRHDLAVINDLIRALHRWYIENIPAEQLQPVISWSRTQPRGFGQLCGCTTQLLGTDLYRELIAPLDDALLGEYPNGGMIHLCGAHAQHIETFRSMKNLRAIQINDRACADLQLYLDGLRDDQIIYMIPCQEMSAEEAVRISGGKRLVICANRPAIEK